MPICAKGRLGAPVHASCTHQARRRSLTRIWMGDRSYVNLAAGISAVSYVWLCTCKPREGEQVVEA
jgi:hypothetical protein